MNDNKSNKNNETEAAPLKQVVRGLTDASLGVVNLFKSTVKATTKWAKKNHVKEKALVVKDKTMDFSRSTQDKIKHKTEDIKEKNRIKKSQKAAKKQEKQDK